MGQLQYFGIESFRLQPVRCSQGTRNLLGLLYIALLRTLVASDQKNHQLPAPLGVVHAVTGSCIDTQFRNAIRQIAVITRMAFSEPTDTGQDASACGYVLESVNPCRELTGTLDLHGEM
ncbi:hypothetical protein A7X68_13370 [Stenotrophomonas maltophilia]|nr:hypothetical protein AS591_02910 [Stenotrophomonas maltophilia]KZC92613.1 hypothetical protein AR273_16030 [Stenotrophomonas maltophilia]PZS44561.1 hypothetical protein A7X61_09600 [Stenotrophomonas maltophilia]PZS61053.1 hypothetical protein A7X58_05910 [Stenotrophomonas maltophilia]PZS65204.1 hypothetical protein A7X68_13370 [Stenotrophomonas maltophilia]